MRNAFLPSAHSKLRQLNPVGGKIHLESDLNCLPIDFFDPNLPSQSKFFATKSIPAAQNSIEKFKRDRKRSDLFKFNHKSQ